MGTTNFSRIEGVVPDSVKEWVELEAMRSCTPIKTIVGNAISLYKSQNESSHLGERVEFMFISEKNTKKNLQNLRANCSNLGKNQPKMIQYTQSLMEILTFLHKKTPKKSRDSIKSLYRGAIADHMEALRVIEYSDNYIYIQCIEIMHKNIFKEYLDYFLQLSKNARDLGDTYNNTIPIQTGSPIDERSESCELISCSMDNDTPYSQVCELASNCLTVPKKYRGEKEEACKEYISTHFKMESVSELICVFINELEKLEQKKDREDTIQKFSDNL